MNYIKESGRFPILEVVYWTAGKSKKAGTPFVELGLLTEKGVVKWTGYLTEKASERTIATIILLGFKGGGPEDFTSGKMDLFSVPQGLKVTVIAENYEGKTYYKARFVKNK